MIVYLIYLLTFLVIGLTINFVSESMLSLGEPHNLNNIDALGFPITLITYLVISIAVIYLAYKIHVTERYIADPNKRLVLMHYRNSFYFTGLSHFIEFLGAIYLLLVFDGGIPIVIDGLKIYLYPVLVVLGYIALCFSAVELFLAVYYARGHENKGLLYGYLIFPAAYIILATSIYNHWGMASWEGYHIGGLTSLFLLFSEVIPVAMGISYYHGKYKSATNVDVKLRLRSLRDGFILIIVSMALLAVYKIAYKPYSVFVIYGELVGIISLILIYSALITPKPIYSYFRLGVKR